jgi:hypothetical protein
MRKTQAGDTDREEDGNAFHSSDQFHREEKWRELLYKKPNIFFKTNLSHTPRGSAKFSSN